MSSRSLNDLAPSMRAKANDFLTRAGRDPWLKANGITVMVTCTFRSFEEQALTYAQGRTQEQLNDAGLTMIKPRPGKVVTWAVPGKSKHNVMTPEGIPAAEAMDVVPLRFGKPIWGTAGNGIDDDPTDDARDDLEVWQRVGEIGESAGLQWAGRWQGNKREFPHFQE